VEVKIQERGRVRSPKGIGPIEKKDIRIRSYRQGKEKQRNLLAERIGSFGWKEVQLRGGKKVRAGRGRVLVDGITKKRALLLGEVIRGGRLQGSWGHTVLVFIKPAF